MQKRQMRLFIFATITLLLIIPTSNSFAANWQELETIVNYDTGKSDYILNIDNLVSDVSTTGTVSGTTVVQAGVSLDDTYWTQSTDQTSLTGDKSGSFDLSTTGTLKIGGTEAQGGLVADTAEMIVNMPATSSPFQFQGTSAKHKDFRFCDLDTNELWQWSMRTAGEGQAFKLFYNDGSADGPSWYQCLSVSKPVYGYIDPDAWTTLPIFDFNASAITTTGPLGAGAITGTSLTDGTATLDDGSITGGVEATFDKYWITPSKIGNLQGGFLYDAAGLPIQDFGLNAGQFGSRDTSQLGTIFRQDARGYATNPFFSVIYQAPYDPDPVGESFPLQMAGRNDGGVSILIGTGWGGDNAVGTGNSEDLQVYGTTYSGTFTDSAATLTAGSLTGAVNGTFSATVQAEQLTSTDDIQLAGTLDFTDTNTQIWEDGSGNLSFKDAVTGTLTLADLDCAKYIYIKATGQAEGDLHLSDGTNWNTSKANIKTLTTYTASTDWDLWLLQNDNGFSTNDANIPRFQMVESGAECTASGITVHLDMPYQDEDASGEVHLYYLDNSGSNTASFYLRGEKMR